MIAPALLLGFALVTGMLGGHVLARATWPSRAPRLGIFVWLALSTSTPTAVVLAGVTLAVPAVRPAPSVVDLLHACWASIRAHYATPGGAATSIAGVAAAVLVSSRLAHRLAVEALGASRSQRHHRERLTLLARADRRRGLVVLPGGAPTVYCLPGRPGLVVCTSSALLRLTEDELTSVLAHEHAHLHGRHHQLLVLAHALRSAFPFVPTFRLVVDQLGLLIEMSADDTARRSGPDRTLGSALVKLAGAGRPHLSAGTLGASGAGGAGLVARVQRLSSRRRGIRPWAVSLIVAAGLALVTAPMAIALGPALVAVVLDYCPPSFVA